MKNIFLYSCFNHWFEDTNAIWIYSDPHFNDPEMPYIRKNYIGDDEQIKRINSKVGKKDVFICLGDVGDVSFVPKIRAKYKILIKGNHDVGSSNYQRKITATEDNHLFDEIYEGPLWISEKVVLSHEPVDLPYVFNIHGHKHSSDFNDDHHLNVCAEHIDYAPVSLIELFKNGTFKKVDSIHRQTIDRATERVKNKLNG